MRYSFFIILLCFSSLASAQVVVDRAVPTIITLTSEFASLQPADTAVVILSNTSTGGMFQYDADSTATVDDADVFNGPGGTGRYIRFANVSPSSVGPTFNDNGSQSGAQSISFAGGSEQQYTATGDITFSFTPPTSPRELNVIIVQDVTGGHAITWPALIGRDPVIDEGANQITVCRFYYDGSNYHTLPGVGTVNVRWYGAEGDGVTDDSAALSAALDAVAGGDTLYIPAGTYNLATWTDKSITASIRIVGEGKNESILVGPDQSTDFLSLATGVSLEVEGIEVDTFQNMFDLASTGTFPLIHLKDCRFENANLVLRDLSGAGEVTELIVTSCRINEITQAGIRCSMLTIGNARIQDNWISNTDGTGSSGGKGIFLGQNDADFSNEKCIVTGNVVEDVNGTFTDCQGIIVFGAYVVISNNVVQDITSTEATNVEGIYTKAHTGVVANNTLKNAGHEEAAIAIKGQARNAGAPTAPLGYGMVVTGNSILNDDRDYVSWGIIIRREDVVCANNIIEGTYHGILVNTDTVDVNVTGIVIQNNIIRGLRKNSAAGVPSTTNHVGIEVRAPVQQCLIQGNTIADVGDDAEVNGAYGIEIDGDNNTLALEISIRNNQIRDLFSSDNTLERGILMNIAPDETARDVDISGNLIDDSAVGIRVNNADRINRLMVTHNSVLRASTDFVVSGAMTINSFFHWNNPHFNSASNADTTPSVLGLEVLETANAGGTSITDFDDGYNGQIITVIVDSNTTIVDDDTNIDLNGDANFAPASGGSITLYYDDQTTWKEMGRAAY